MTDCLIDTGASLSIVSRKTWDNIKASCPELTVFKPPIFTASGKQVDVQGQTQAIFELSGVKSITEIIIADIDIDVILGLDFLKANTCQIDAAN